MNADKLEQLDNTAQWSSFLEERGRAAQSAASAPGWASGDRVLNMAPPFWELSVEVLVPNTAEGSLGLSTF